MTPARKNPQLAFLLGFGMSFLPSFGPFAGILFVLTSRLRARRGDVVWFVAAALWAVSLGVHRHGAGVAFGLLQALGPWAVYRAFSEMRRPRVERLAANRVLHGLFAGFAGLVAIGLGHVSLNLAYPTITQAIAWGGNAALFAHMALVVGSLIALLSDQGWLRTTTLAVAAVAVLAAGSREAALALLAVTLFMALRAAAGRHRGQLLGLGAVGSALFVMLAFGPVLGLGNIGYLLAPATQAGGTNLVQGSELPAGDWWDRQGVTFRTGTVQLAGQSMTVYDVTKQRSAGWVRLQQVITLHPGRTYTASTWVLDDGPQHPGIQGWGRRADGLPFTLQMRLVDQRLRTTLDGAGTLESSGVAAAQGPWKRIFATFRYGGGGEPLHWYVGLTPDARAGQGATTSFAGFQLEQGPLTAYVPGPATRGLGWASGRSAMWAAAWTGFLRKPWLGWGSAAFPTFYQRAQPVSAADTAVPAHAHSLYLQTLFAHGIVGFLALILLLVGLLRSAVRRRDAGLLVVAGAVLLANVFDYTFFFGGVIYPLAAAAGWRSGERSTAPAADSLSRQFVVRLVLAGSDLALAWLAFRASIWLLPGLQSAPGPGAGSLDLVRYALLLWPAMAWLEGLYPGYGLTEPDELKRQVRGVALAGITLLAASVFLEGALGVSPATVGATALLTLLLVPAGRGVSKRLLRSLGLWGRPVVILGGGRAAANIAQTLLQRTLDGLRPVAAFAGRPGDDPPDWAVEGVPLLGPIAAANAFAQREGIHHAIVAIDPTRHDVRLARLDPVHNPFTIVQYVPDLPGLPVLGVRASSLDNLLALEVRNELASPVNRFVKRAIDVTAVIVGGIAISPVLLAIAVAIAVDSRGPLFFTHRRLGRGGRPIRVWKFRTMVEGADAALERHLSEDAALRAEWEANRKLKRDPRVTRVGRFLRRFSLDELPQLWNVLKGDMSLVGPRPIVQAEVPKYADAFDLYGMVRPGMTGYWQISGRSDTDYGQRVELDSFYVRNWSVWLDIVVLLKTVSVVLKRHGAY